MSDNSSHAFSQLHQFTCDDIIFATRTIKTILLLVLCSFTLYLGLQRRRRQQRCSDSHSDLFTYHLAVMELVWVWGFCCLKSNDLVLSKIGFCACLVGFYGEILFHVLTCVERYLAVVHPITYLRLKHTRGVRIRNTAIGCVWLLCFGLTCTNLVTSSFESTPLCCLLVVSIISTSFCSLSVLCALIRPGLRRGEKVDQSKQRAFKSITFIWSVLCLWFVLLLLQIILRNPPLYNETVYCVVTTILNGVNLLGSLVLPTLYLHRAGRLSCCCFNKLKTRTVSP